MDIGNKLKQARIRAKVTQEQVAEHLGVSRQTISNWENEKTYPDIKSVVILSDFYYVSLDHLLKDEEEPVMTNYIDYLDESTNTVKSRTRMSQLILVLSYLCIWAVSLIVFWFFTSGSDAMGFSLMFLWILLPITTLIVSFLIGRNRYFGRWKWVAPVAMGVMYMLAEYGTFQMANMITFDKINSPSWEMLFTGAVLSFVGLGFGEFFYRINVKRNKKNS